MSYHPTVDTIGARLHSEGWSVGDVAVKYPTGCVWVASGQRDGRWLVAEGRTQDDAWRRFSIENAHVDHALGSRPSGL
jgi:hypothetical protein